MMKIKYLIFILMVLVLVNLAYAVDLNCNTLLFNDSFDYIDDFTNHNWASYVETCAPGSGYPLTTNNGFGFPLGGSCTGGLHAIKSNPFSIDFQNTRILFKITTNYTGDALGLDGEMLLKNDTITSASVKFQNTALSDHVTIHDSGGAKLAESTEPNEGDNQKHELIFDFNGNAGTVTVYRDDVNILNSDPSWGNPTFDVNNIELEMNIDTTKGIIFDDIEICEGTLTATVEEACPLPLIFCDDFDYNTSMTGNDWIVYFGGGTVNTSFAPVNSELQLLSEKFTSPYHVIAPFDVEYRQNEDLTTTKSQYSPVFSSDFELNITEGGFKYVAYDSAFARNVYDINAVVDAVGGGVYPDDLLLYWRMEEGTGVTLQDSSTKDHDGLVSDTLWNESKGGNGTGTYSLWFDGSTSFADSDDVWDYYSDINFTISAWVMLNDSSPLTNKTIISRMDASNIRNFNMGINPSNEIFFDTFSSCSSLASHMVSDTIVTKNQWYFITWQLEKDVMKRIYVNGVLDYNESITPSVPSGCGAQPIVIGENPDDVDSSFFGWMDEVSIFNRTLSEAEIDLMYDDGVALVEPSISNISWYRRSSAGDYELICANCTVQDEIYDIKITSYFKQSAFMPFNSTITNNSVILYIDGEEKGSFPFADDEAVNVYEHFIVKQDDYKFVMDNYNVYTGTDPIIDTSQFFYNEYYEPEEDNVTDEHATQEDLAEVIDDFWCRVGICSTSSKIMTGLILMFLLAVFVFGAYVSHGVAPNTGVIVIIEVIFMIFLVFIQLIPVWVLILLAILGAGIGAIVVKQHAT